MQSCGCSWRRTKQVCDAATTLLKANRTFVMLVSQENENLCPSKLSQSNSHCNCATSLEQRNNLLCKSTQPKAPPDNFSF